MAEKSVIVSEANLNDVEWIAQSQATMAMETENVELIPEHVLKGVNYIFQNPMRGFYLIARSDRQTPLGCLLILKEWSDWRNGDVWWIHSVYVLPEYRCLGIFRQMFEYVEKLARSSGVRGLRLYVDKTNRQAQKVYEQLGMNHDHYVLFEKMF